MSNAVDIPSNESTTIPSSSKDETINNEPIPPTNVRYIFLPDKFLGRKKGVREIIEFVNDFL